MKVGEKKFFIHQIFFLGDYPSCEYMRKGEVAKREKTNENSPSDRISPSDVQNRRDVITFIAFI